MGHRGLNNTFDTNMKLFVTLAGLLAAAQAEAFYGYGYGLHQQNWPTAYGPGFERTIWGARGKRDADADAYGYGGLGLGSGGFIRQSRPGLAQFGMHHNGYGAFAHPVGKRSADAWGYGYAPFYGRALGGAGLHPTGVSYSNRSPQGLHKRDADAEAFGYGYAPVLAKGYPSWPGVVAPGFESTCYGCGLGKRSADADAAYYTQRSPQGAYGLGYGRGYYWG